MNKLIRVVVVLVLSALTSVCSSVSTSDVRRNVVGAHNGLEMLEEPFGPVYGSTKYLVCSHGEGTVGTAEVKVNSLVGEVSDVKVDWLSGGSKSTACGQRLRRLLAMEGLVVPLLDVIDEAQSLEAAQLAARNVRFEIKKAAAQAAH